MTLLRGHEGHELLIVPLYFVSVFFVGGTFFWGYPSVDSHEEKIASMNIEIYTIIDSSVCILGSPIMFGM